MPDNGANRVLVSDVNMPFFSMVRFMIKWAIASIPALLILTFLGFVFWALLFGFVSGLGSSLTHKAQENPSSGSPGASASASDDSATAAYLSSVIVRNVTVSKSDLGEDGIFGEVKNIGDRTLRKVEITIYCKDAEGKTVFEKQYDPVLVTKLSLGDNNPLKPGYARQFGVRLSDAPSDWSKKVDVKVSTVEFQ